MSRIDTVKTEVFKFDELSEKAQQAAIEKLYDLNVDYDWWDSVYDDAKTIAALMGIDIDDIWFSGFSSQGDGACFEGSYEYQKGAPKAVRDYAPLDNELVRIANELQDIQKKRFYGLHATVKQSGRCNHEYCTDINVYERRTLRDGHETDEDASIEVDEAIVEALRDFMRWIYKQLKKEYDYRTGEEAIKDCIEADDYEFTAEGKLY